MGGGRDFDKPGLGLLNLEEEDGAKKKKSLWDSARKFSAE